MKIIGPFSQIQVSQTPDSMRLFRAKKLAATIKVSTQGASASRSYHQGANSDLESTEKRVRFDRGER